MIILDDNIKLCFGPKNYNLNTFVNKLSFFAFFPENIFANLIDFESSIYFY